MTPKVSIIMAVYNCERYIRDSILSVINQTESDMEIIIVDDGSTDSTLAIIKNMAGQDRRIIIRTQPHSGRPGVGKNTGLKTARGQYISFLDGDDLYESKKVETCVKLLEDNPNISMVFHDVKLIDEFGSGMKGSYLQNAEFMKIACKYLINIGHGIFICSKDFYNFMSMKYTAMLTSSVMIRHSLLREGHYMFPEDVSIGEDIEFWWILALGRQVIFIDQVLSYYRQHDKNITKNVIKVCNDSIVVHVRNYRRGFDVFSRKEREAYKQKISDHWFLYGYTHYLEFRMRDARREYIQSLKWHLSFKYLMAYFKTYIPQQAILILRSLRGQVMVKGRAV